MVPYWKSEGEGIESRLTGDTGKRAIGMALVESELWEGDEIEIEIRGRKTSATIVHYFLRSEAPPYARAILHHRPTEEEAAPSREGAGKEKIYCFHDLP